MRADILKIFSILHAKHRKTTIISRIEQYNYIRMNRFIDKYSKKK